MKPYIFNRVILDHNTKEIIDLLFRDRKGLNAHVFLPTHKEYRRLKSVLNEKVTTPEALDNFPDLFDKKNYCAHFMETGNEIMLYVTDISCVTGEYPIVTVDQILTGKITVPVTKYIVPLRGNIAEINQYFKDRQLEVPSWIPDNSPKGGFS